MLKLDHITVIAPSLAEGVSHVRTCLDLDVPFGQRHAYMGTHNHLLQLGDTVYLEIVALDPRPTGRAAHAGSVWTIRKSQVRLGRRPALARLGRANRRHRRRSLRAMADLRREGPASGGQSIFRFRHSARRLTSARRGGSLYYRQAWQASLDGHDGRSGGTAAILHSRTSRPCRRGGAVRRNGRGPPACNRSRSQASLSRADRNTRGTEGIDLSILGSSVTRMISLRTSNRSGMAAHRMKRVHRYLRF